jgi:hypothetical protein
VPEVPRLGENLLKNPSFEASEETIGLPTVFRDWGGDVTEIVANEEGISSLDGDRMLQFSGTGGVGQQGGRTGDILQYVDLSPFAVQVEAGHLTALLTGNFNRVARNEQTDTEFDVVIAAHSGTPESSPGLPDSLVYEIGSLISDSNPATWEEASVELPISPDADFLQVTLSAIENIVANSEGVEFDGHFADDASLIVYIRGDFDFDGAFTALDIDELTGTILNGAYDRLMDLDKNGVLNSQDRHSWVVDLRKTTYGDANLDSEFNSSDLVQVLAAGEYEDTIAGNSGWASGDFDGDGDFTSSDLVTALAGGGYEAGMRPAPVVVPAPRTCLTAIWSLVFIFGIARRSRLNARLCRPTGV